MTIELFGLPGIGKSITAQALSDLGYQVITLKTRRELVWYASLYVLHYPISTAFWILMIIRQRTSLQMLYLKLVNLILQHQAKYIKAQSFPRAVIDQGPLQNILSVFETTLSDTQLKRCQKYLTWPDLLVILDGSDTLRESRLVARGYRSREEFGPEYGNTWSQIISHNYRVFLENLPYSKKPFLILDAVGTPQTLAQTIHHETLLHR